MIVLLYYLKMDTPSQDDPHFAAAHSSPAPVEKASADVNSSVEGIPTHKTLQISTEGEESQPNLAFNTQQSHPDSASKTKPSENVQPNSGSVQRSTAAQSNSSGSQKSASVGGSPQHHPSTTITSESELSDSPSDGSYELARDIIGTMTPILYGIEEKSGKLETLMYQKEIRLKLLKTQLCSPYCSGIIMVAKAVMAVVI